MSMLRDFLDFKSQRHNIDGNALGSDGSRLTIRKEIQRSSLLDEFYVSATLTVAFSSIVSAKARGVVLKNVSRPLAYIPAKPFIFSAVAAGLAPRLVHSGLISVLQDYYARLAFASALSDSPALGWSNGQHPEHGELVQLVDLWQRACVLANVVTHQLYDIEHIDDPVRNHKLISTQQLIKDAISGKCPCVRRDGTVYVPGLLDQRRDERHALGWTVWLDAGGTRERATLQDISAGGMGLTVRPGHPIGALIAVQLSNARCLTGVVVWSQKDRIGVRLLQPLSPTDPLLSGAAEDRQPALN